MRVGIAVRNGWRLQALMSRVLQLPQDSSAGTVTVTFTLSDRLYSLRGYALMYKTVSLTGAVDQIW